MPKILSGNSPKIQRQSQEYSSQWLYQEQMADRVIETLYQEKPTALCMSTSTGKSYCLVHILNKHFQKNQNSRVVFLGSNRTELARQFHEVLSSNCSIQIGFTYSMIKEQKPTQLKIGLPMQVLRSPEKINLLVLDEAQWLWSQVEANPNSMMAQILRACSPDCILLLSGSPAFFNKRKDQYHIHYLSYQDVPNRPDRVFSRVDMDLIYVSDRNDIELCLRSLWKKAKQNRDDLSQIAVIAKDIAQAESIKSILESHFRLNCLISTSQHDSNSENLKQFKTGRHDCIVTVGRMIAGYSYSGLTSIWDFRTSRHLSNSFQLFSRLLRVKNESTIKTFFRVATPRTYQDEVRFLIQIRCLLDRENYTSYVEAA